MKRKEIKWRREGHGTMTGRQDGIIFRIFHPWDAPEQVHTVSCHDTRDTGRTISTVGHRTFTWEAAVEFCQKIAAGEIDLENLRAEFAAEDEKKGSGGRSAGPWQRPRSSGDTWSGREFRTPPCWNWRRCGQTWGAWATISSWDMNTGRAGRMGPDENGHRPGRFTWTGRASRAATYREGGKTDRGETIDAIGGRRNHKPALADEVAVIWAEAAAAEVRTMVAAMVEGA